MSDYLEGVKAEENISMIINTIKCCCLNIYNSEDINFINKEGRTLKREANKLIEEKIKFLRRYNENIN